METKERNLSRRFIGQISRKLELPIEVCDALIQAGWTLDVQENKQAVWVQPWPNERKN